MVSGCNLPANTRLRIPAGHRQTSLPNEFGVPSFAGAFSRSRLTVRDILQQEGYTRLVNTIIVATRNKHKLAEIRALLGLEFKLHSLAEFPTASNVVEDAPTFEGNATKKALSLARYLREIGFESSDGAWVLADDSGLEVDALNGAPGVLSARFAALDTQPAASGNSSDSANNEKLLRLLRNVPLEKRTGRFRCVIALAPIVGRTADSASPVCYADEAELEIELFRGSCEGHLAFEPAGVNGFGYDPLFIPAGYEVSFAQLGEEAKNQISHRAKALAALQRRFAAPGTPDSSGSTVRKANALI